MSLIVALDCLRKFNVMHELMHGIGFWHEQQRDDRDQYVNVFYENLIASIIMSKLEMVQGYLIMLLILLFQISMRFRTIEGQQLQDWLIT